jgi:hypothetical protein
MNDHEFWTITEAAAGDLGLLTEGLAALPVEAIARWDAFLLDLLLAVHRHPALSDLALGATGRPPGDALDDFGAWLVLQGRAVYQAALEEPGNLLGHLGRDCQAEGLMYCAGEAFSEKTGLDLDDYEGLFEGLG